MCDKWCNFNTWKNRTVWTGTMSQNKFCFPFLPFHFVFTGSMWEPSSLRASTMPHNVEMNQKYFLISSQFFFSSVFQIFLTFTFLQNFSQSFLKIIAKFRISKFHQKLENTNVCTPMFLYSFFKIFLTTDNSRLHHDICKIPSKKLEVFPKFDSLPIEFKIFQ